MVDQNKWQQCLKMLAEKRLSQFEAKFLHNPDRENAFWIIGQKHMVLIKDIRQDDIDETAALLGKRIYVYPILYNAKSIPLQYSITDLNGNELWAFQTNQTNKLEATKEGLMSIVEKMK